MGDPALRRALLLIDFQYDFLADDGRMPVDRSQVQPVVEAARAAIARAQGAGNVIIKIGNEFRPSDYVRNCISPPCRHGRFAGCRLGLTC